MSIEHPKLNVEQPAQPPLSPEETGKRLRYRLGQTGFFETISIDADATRDVLSRYLQTGELDPILNFFDRNNDPEVASHTKRVNGREAMRRALRAMGVAIPKEIEVVEK